MNLRKTHIGACYAPKKNFLLPVFGLLIMLFFLAPSVHAQTHADSVWHKKHRIWIYAGLGPNYYFNNLVTAKKLVNEFNYSIVTRVMWQPEHLLSLGIETGYIRLYNIKTDTPANVRIANSAIPLHIVVSMKFMRNYYFNLSMGQSILLNKVHSGGYGDFDATSVSLSDFGATIGYRYWLQDRISICTEAKFFYSSHNNDKNVALVFLAAYNL